MSLSPFSALFAPAKPFSEVVEAVARSVFATSEHGTSANPSVYRTLRANEGMDRTHLTLADIARTKTFATAIRAYSENYGGAKNFLVNRFNTVVTNKVNFDIETAKVDRNLWAISVMNTTANVISFQMSSQSGTQNYTQEAVAYDTYALQFREGVEKLNIEVAAVNAHIIANFALTATVAILQAFTGYARSAAFCAFMSDARDIKVAFQNQARLHGAFSKSEFATTDVFSQLDRVFASHGGFHELITSRESAIGMLQQQDININFMKSGESAAETQNRIDVPVRMMGKRISALPVVDPEPHNTTDYRYLNRECQTITIAPFYDLTRRQPWDKFRTSQRSIEYVDYITDDWSRYDQIDAIEALPWFKKDGSLDVEWLGMLAEDASIEYTCYHQGKPMTNIAMKHRPFELCGTVPEGTAAETAFPLLRFIGKNEMRMLPEDQQKAFPYGRFVVCKTIGELPRQNIKTEYFEQIYRQIFAEYKKRYDAIKKGEETKDQDSVLASLFHKNPFTTADEKEKTKANPITKKDTYIVAGIEDEGIRNVPENDATSMSIFNERLVAARKLGDELMLIAVFYLNQPINAVFFRKCAKNNINLPLGIVNFRVESRLMRSMLATSLDANGTFGTAFTTGIEIGQIEKQSTMSGEHKQGQFTLGGSYGAAITDPFMICPLLNVQGSHTLEGCGGNGNEYFPQRGIYENKFRADNVRRLIAQGRSNFAVLTSANAMIEQNFPEVTSISGYVVRGDLQQFLDDSPEYGKNRRQPLYYGQHMFMYANPFFDRTSDAMGAPSINVERLSFNDLVYLRNYSHMAGIGSIRHWTPTGTTITPETHLDGPRLPGMRKRDQGLCMVGRGVSEGKGVFLTSRGNMVGAGGVGGAKKMRLERI